MVKLGNQPIDKWMENGGKSEDFQGFLKVSQLGKKDANTLGLWGRLP